VNNWDLVDSSAPYILGAWLLEEGGLEARPGLLDSLAASASLWDRRIAVLATFRFIRAGRFGETLRLAERLLGDREDLIHKAVGWMLREIGERDREAEEVFLRRHCRTMPRTMLRYAIEKFPEPRRQAYLKGRP
ncbi:MAG TPA: DNA alkylation repair protein, partial [Fibrobacteria bacterium]|nr:DNA alkylation repair protein [Fibrobacteria bacterium]